jgi:cell division protein FtsI/penicillin-binding protein 2
MNYPSNRVNVLKYLIFLILIIVNSEHLFVSVVEQETYQMQQL